MALNIRYSRRDCTGQRFTDRPAAEFAGEIVGSCFWQEAGALSPLDATPWVEVFPADLRGVTFLRCNLDNVVLPAGNTPVDCTHKAIKETTNAETGEPEIWAGEWVDNVFEPQELISGSGVVLEGEDGAII